MDLPVLITSGLIFNGLTIALTLLVIVVRNGAKLVTRHNLSRWLRWDITLSVITIAVEIASAALEQTAPHKLKTAEYGVMMAAVSLVSCLADLVYKKYMQHRKRNKSHLHFDWDFADSFGFLSSILTLITASLHYHYLSNAKQQPIQFSVLPLAFSMCIFCSCVLKRPAEQLTFIMRCMHLGPMNLDVEVGGQLYGEDGPTQFICSVCQMGQMHLHEA